MPTPINHAISDDGKLYFRSELHVGKMKRIRNNPRVLVVPWTFRGKPRGAASEGIARELSGEAERASELIKSNWGAVMRPLRVRPRPARRARGVRRGGPGRACR
jgi:PPOX class probable F420-dependent enzyme